MTIKTLTDLKKNAIITELNNQQSQFDNTDNVILSNNFTRSPMHAITFLIAYAGLSENQRQTALSNLNNVKINKVALDDLMLDIDWPAVLKNGDLSDTLAFEFSIGIANKEYFLSAVKDKCPILHKALIQNNCMVNIQETDEVVFTTKISQNELWLQAFNRDTNNNFWTVPKFQLSPSLTQIIQGLAETKTMTSGAFHIQKGLGHLAKNVELRITAPNETNEFAIENKIKVNPGIYGAFIGLYNFYGLERVDGVIVELESQAKFSDKGASASQTQVVTCYTESCCLRSKNEPTVITVEDLHVLFQGADIVANFAKSPKEAFNGSQYITLPTQSKSGTGVSLLAQMPTPKEAFLLHLDKNTLVNQKEPSTSFFSFNSKPNEQPKNQEDEHQCRIS